MWVKQGEDRQRQLEREAEVERKRWQKAEKEERRREQKQREEEEEEEKRRRRREEKKILKINKNNRDGKGSRLTRLFTSIHATTFVSRRRLSTRRSGASCVQILERRMFETNSNSLL